MKNIESWKSNFIRALFFVHSIENFAWKNSFNIHQSIRKSGYEIYFTKNFNNMMNLFFKKSHRDISKEMIMDIFYEILQLIYV